MSDISMESYKREVQAVKDLGDQIGYGNMMEIASALWAIDLSADGLPEEVAFCITIDSNLKDSDLTKLERFRRKQVIQMIRGFLEER